MSGGSFEGLLRVKICSGRNILPEKHLLTATFTFILAPWLIYYAIFLPDFEAQPFPLEPGFSWSLAASRLILVLSCCFCFFQFAHGIRVSGLINGLIWDNSFIVFSHGWNTYRTCEASTRTDPSWLELIPIILNEHNLDYSLQFSLYGKKLIEANKLLASCRISLDDLIALYKLQNDDFNMSGLAELDSVLKERSYRKSNGLNPRLLDALLPKHNSTNAVKFTLTKGRIRLPLYECCEEQKRRYGIPELELEVSFDTAESLSKRLWYWIFNQFDDRNERKINKLELGACLEAVGRDINDEQLDALFEPYDEESLPWRKAYEILSKSENILTQLNTLREASCTSAFVLFRTCPVCNSSLKSESRDVIVHLAICISSGSSSLIENQYITRANASTGWLLRMQKYLTRGTYQVGANTGNIFVQDRETGEIIEERMPVYIRLGIRVLYQTVLRRNIGNRTKELLKSLTIQQGKKFDSPDSISEIKPFVQFHKIDLEEIEASSIHEYKCFNEFFYRKLKPQARAPESMDPKVALSPADCRCVVFQHIHECKEFWVKGQNFTIDSLLGDELGFSHNFHSMAICRLAPQDYHRFHSPVECTLESSYSMDGQYYTVNPMAIRERIDVFTDNKRTISILNSPKFGRIAYVCVGAMMVGSIVHTAKVGQRLRRLDEIGYFAFGGSTIILLFEKNTIRFDKDLVANSQKPIETLLKVGSSLGRTTRRRFL